MSLLMEALRKAEEAKRIAAQKPKEIEAAEGQSTHGTAPVAQNLTEEDADKVDSHAQEQSEETVQEEPADEMLSEFSFATEEPSEAHLSEDEDTNLDIPFDFQIDESFGVSAEDSAPEAAVDTDSNAEPVENIIEFDLSPAMEETPTPTLRDEIDSDDVSAVEFSAEPPLESKPEPEPEATPAPQISTKPERVVEKVADNRAAEESRKRESARAVFSAKSPLKSSGNKRKLLLVASVLALIPLAGGSYLLLNELGIIGTGNQYNIPASYTPGERSFAEPLEVADNSIDAGVLPDVSDVSDVGAVVLIDPAAIDTALESVVSAIAPVINPPAAPITAVSAEATNVEESLDATEQSIDPLETSAGEVVADIDAPQIAMPAAEAQATQASTAPVVEDTPPSPTVAPENPISIVRSDNTPRVDPRLVQAYDAFTSNDFITARAHYQQALRETPNSRDAMLGIAAVALKVGDNVSARDAYLKLLQLDPRDVLARVGLLETMPASDPIALESELRSLFAQHPDVAHLPFSLGNLYASQRRWNEAQQSYYDALLAAKSGSAGPVSPDYAFNLAVSLERLNQIRPAYQFYREALEQSRVVNPTFDPRILRERLDALERQLP